MEKYSLLNNFSKEFLKNFTTSQIIEFGKGNQKKIEGKGKELKKWNYIHLYQTNTHIIV